MPEDDSPSEDVYGPAGEGYESRPGLTLFVVFIAVVLIVLVFVFFGALRFFLML